MSTTETERARDIDAAVKDADKKKAADAAAAADAKSRADAEAGEKIDRILSCLDALGADGFF